jgi:hypothetical protein
MVFWFRVNCCVCVADQYTGVVDLPNAFVADHINLTDVSPPYWYSTYNSPDNFDSLGLPLPPSPRVGIQEARPPPTAPPFVL